MSTFPLNFHKRPAHVVFPIKVDAMRKGYAEAEAFFTAAGFDPAKARELARRCVSNYRAIAGGQAEVRDGSAAFTREAFTAILRSEGVL